MRVSLYTLGCKVNQYETDALAELFREKGFDLVPFGDEADLCVVNTCTVTARAAYQCRQVLRRIARNLPSARVVATGCYVQTAPQEILDAMPGPICLVGNSYKHEIPRLALHEGNNLEMYIGSMGEVKYISPLRVARPMGRTRAYIRVQDGCDAFCSYCIVPYARGMPRSLPPGQVFKQVEAMDENGIREVVVTGIHLGLYGRDLGEEDTGLLSLLKGLCRRFPETRFRMSSIEPVELDTHLISWASETPNFCRHFHLPLQSGSNKILSAMNRHYTKELFLETCALVRGTMEDAAIGVDVMVGFPGEEAEDFQETVDLLRALPITYVHCFPYSPRPGTLAHALGDPVPRGEKSARAAKIREIGQEKKEAFYRAQEGKPALVLFEQIDRETGMWKGLTSNYTQVLVDHKGSSLEGKMLPVVLVGSTSRYLIGKLEKG